MDRLRAQRRRAPWPRPAKFDRNLVVIGAGSAGLTAAYLAAALKAKVSLIEKHKMGGDCLNTGCVPSKALIRSAGLLSQIRRAREFGISDARAEFDFVDVMERVQRIVRAAEPHDSVERFTALGVECIHGEAKITSPYTVEARTPDRSITLTTRAIVIAAGARPVVPQIPGIDDVGYVTSDTLWSLRELPKRLLMLGGGPVGCELAQCFARFGSKVIQIEMLPRLLAREDPEFSMLVRERFAGEGIDVRTRHNAKRFAVRDGIKSLVAEADGCEVEITFDLLLCALGRVANTTGYGLEELGIATVPPKTIETNEYLQTVHPNIYACGDVAGPYQFTHTASHQAWYAAVNALVGRFHRFRADYSVIPWTTFTDPEIARVGLNEIEAQEKGIAYEITRFGFDELDRAIIDDETQGLVKVLTVPEKDHILGVTIAGEHAGDLIAEFVLAMKHGLGLKKILSTIHVYPTFAEAARYAAVEWRRAHFSDLVLRLLQRYHAWQRG